MTCAGEPSLLGGRLVPHHPVPELHLAQKGLTRLRVPRCSHPALTTGISQTPQGLGTDSPHRDRKGTCRASHWTHPPTCTLCADRETEAQEQRDTRNRQWQGSLSPTLSTWPPRPSHHPPLTLPLSCPGLLKNPGTSCRPAHLFLLERHGIFPGRMSWC